MPEDRFIFKLDLALGEFCLTTFGWLVRKWLDGNPPKKAIVIPDKLVNLVV